MSARSKKSKSAEQQQSEEGSSTVTTTTTVKKSTTSTGPSTPASRSRSSTQRPASPLSITRSEEQEELAHLNDRFASYIDYVRSLENAKEQLQKRVQTVTESQHIELGNIKKMYENEISSLRDNLDKLAKDKAAKDVDLKKALSDYDNMKSKLGKRDQEVKNLQKRCEQLEKDLSNYKLDHDRYEALKSDHNALERQYEIAVSQLEKETLLRTDLENKVQTMKEELNFQNNLHKEEMAKTIMRTTTIEEEITKNKEAEFQSRLAEELQEIREQTTEELESYKLEIETTFNTKFDEMKATSDKQSRDSYHLREELIHLRSLSDDLKQQLATKTSENELLQKRIKALEDLIKKERSDFEEQVQYFKDQNEKLKNDLEERFQEFNDLMNTKIKLDQEILMYRKMLEGEEGRLNIPSPARSSPFQSGSKRRRVGDPVSFEESSLAAYKSSSSAKGNIEIVECDPQGKFVKLSNKSDDEICIGNWQIKHVGDGRETVYKFHRTLHIKGGANCTIWSSDATNVNHNPPTDLIMKGQRFFTGASMKTILIDIDGEEAAILEMEREKRSHIIPRRSRRGATDDKCGIM